LIQGVYIMPHPPLMVPGIGDAALITDTIKAAREAADEIAKLKPDTVIVISPHAIVYRDFIYINRQPKLSGSFSNFGRRDIRSLLRLCILPAWLLPNAVWLRDR
jgi:aromatic ring-opening dioxygenase LigB subunit